MGATPSEPTDEQAAELQGTLAVSIERAAAAVAKADVLLLATGAGWSADSGLAVYKDVATILAYGERGVSYHDLCRPRWLQDEPALFHGFWGGCFNDYRAATPHDGYGIVARWRDQLFTVRARPGRLRALSVSNSKSVFYGAFCMGEQGA